MKYNKNQSELAFDELKKTKWWARLIDRVNKLSIVAVLLWLASVIYIEGGVEDPFYVFIAMSTVFLGVISFFRLFIYLFQYVIYGKVTKFSAEIKPYYLQTTIWIYILFVLFCLTWAFLGS